MNVAKMQNHINCMYQGVGTQTTSCMMITYPGHELQGSNISIYHVSCKIKHNLSIVSEAKKHFSRASFLLSCCH